MSDYPTFDQKPTPFYYNEDGLCFTCQRQCAACCKIPGRVEISEEDAVRMAAHLGMKADAFHRKYTRVKNRLLLKERDDGSCVMLGKDDKCMVYPVRPRQCSSYPFWDEILANDFTWLLEKNMCPGIDVGKKYSPEEIDAIRIDKAKTEGY